MMLLHVVNKSKFQKYIYYIFAVFSEVGVNIWLTNQNFKHFFLLKNFFDC